MPFRRDRLKQRRIDMGLTLQEVADFVNVSKPTVQRYESGRICNMDTLIVEKLAHAIKCEPSYLVGWTDEIYKQKNDVGDLLRTENELIISYRSLNVDGKEKILNYIDDLVTSGKYNIK